MRLQLSFLLLSIATALLLPSEAKPPPYAFPQFNPECINPSHSGPYLECDVDLTLGIDMSVAMGSGTNVATLVRSVLQLTTNYLQNSTNTAVITFGDGGVTESQFFKQYENLCEYVNAELGKSSVVGLHGQNLSEVFQAYHDQVIYSNRKIQQVFLLFTGVTDPDNVKRAFEVTETLRDVQIFVVVLNSTSIPSAYSNIADRTWSSPDYEISSDLASKILAHTCFNSGVTPTVAPPPTTTTEAATTAAATTTVDQPTKPSGPNVSLSPVTTTTTSSPSPTDGLGTPCADNLSKAWLDIVLVVDVSESMRKSDLNNLGYNLKTAFDGLTIGQGKGTHIQSHTSRISLITITDVAQVQWSLGDADNSTLDRLKQLEVYKSNIDGSSNVVKGLKAAYTVSQTEKSFRKQVIILVAATYSDVEMHVAEHIATQLKNDDVTIFVISYIPVDGLNTNDKLKKLASEDYFYQSDSQNYTTEISFGLTQVNCFCPQYTLQLRVKNTKFADCLQGQTAVINPDWVNDSCAPGVGIAVESPEKLDFTVSKLVPLFPSQIQEFSTGALFKNGKWVWSGYGNADKEFGSFPAVSSKDGDYGYFKNDGSKWHFVGGKAGKDNARAYICQTKACDTDYFCDLSASKKFVF